jgi:arylsulfatase A-like enzyme
MNRSAFQNVTHLRPLITAKRLRRAGASTVALMACVAASACSSTKSPSELVASQAQAVSAPLPATKMPNVVVLILDDVGFGHLSPFGGPIPVPNIQRVAASGLRYTNFHTTALCSPSRAALLTGRNHHSVGTGKITELASSDPGYTGRIPTSAATFAEVLHENGYATYALGKWHNTPLEELTTSGPYDLWPQGLGFDHFYGFQGGDTNQWHPNIWDDKTPTDPGAGRTDYLLDRDLGDHAVAYIDAQAKSGQPFFLYLAPGTAHAPHHAPREVIDQNKGIFDQGWDKVREETFARQKQMGIMPANAQLPPRPDEIDAWDHLSSDEQRLFIRMQEVYAGAIEYADAQFGRVLDELEKTGHLNDTIIMITSDNGASGEGGLEGSVNEMRVANGLPENLALNMSLIDELGGPEAFNHYPAGWALAGNTPGQYWKQTVNEGGVRDPFVIAWPNGIAARGEIRTQFTHLVDVAPTLYDLTGIQMPGVVNGVTQMPLEGVSFAPTLASATATTAKDVQYFEMFGNRGLWSGGFKAVVFHGRMPWNTTYSNEDFDADVWKLYDTVADPNETVDLAAQNPAKLAELQALFTAQATEHNVFPLDDSTSTLIAANMARILGNKRDFLYQGVTRATAEPLSPPVKNQSHTIIATVDVGAAGADGVLATAGGRFGGFSFYVKNDKLTYVHNYVGETMYTIVSDDPVPTGHVELKFVFTKTGQNQGTGALYINGKLTGQGHIPRTVPGMFSFTESFDTGLDTGTAAGDYDVPFAFKGTLDTVEVTLDDLPAAALDVAPGSQDEQGVCVDE